MSGDIAFEAVAGEYSSFSLLILHGNQRRGFEICEWFLFLSFCDSHREFSNHNLIMVFFSQIFSIPPEKNGLFLAVDTYFSDPFLKIVLLIIFFVSIFDKFLYPFFCYLTAANEDFNFTIKDFNSFQAFSHSF